MRDPAFFIAGAITLSLAGGFAVGGAAALGTDNPQTAVGLVGLAAGSAALGAPLLMLGGAFHCYEGSEKLAHKLFPAPEGNAAEHAKRVAALADPAVDLVSTVHSATMLARVASALDRGAGAGKLAVFLLDRQ